jgi:hypothetical protein
MNKIFGNFIVGVWILKDNTMMFPRELEERQNEFEWVKEPNTDKYWPHQGDYKLIYDEEE